MVIVGSEKTIRLWEVATSEFRQELKGHGNRVLALDCSGDGRSLVSGSADGTGLVWDLYPPGEHFAPTGVLSAEDLQALWADLAGSTGARAYRAVSALAAAPRQAVPLLREHLKPVSAAESRRIARLIADLDDDRFTVREAATAELERLGNIAADALRLAVVATSSPEVRRRGKEVLESLGGKTSPERLRTIRALEVLEQIGEGDSRALLRVLSEGAPDAWLTEEAKAALERLAHRSPGSP
jgi:hypothetical protein